MSQESRSSLLVYLSSSDTCIEVARLVQAQLEDEGYKVWLDEKRADDDSLNIQSIVDDALRFAEANVLLTLDSGDLSKVEAARKRKVPVVLLKTGDSLPDVLVELKQIALRMVALMRAEPMAMVLNPTSSMDPHRPKSVPKPVEPESLSANPEIGNHALLNIPTLLMMVFVFPHRMVMVTDWLQLLLLTLVLSVAGWTHSDQGRQAQVRVAQAKSGD